MLFYLLDLPRSRRQKHWRLGRCYTNDTTLNTGAGGDRIRDFDDGTRKWPASFICYGDVSDPGPISSPNVVTGYSQPLPVGIGFGGSQIDPRSIRALTSGDVVSAVQSGTWNVGLSTGSNVIGAVTQSGTWNVTVNTALPTGSNTIGAVTQASGPWTINVTQIGGSALTLGSKTSANSIPVVVASDQAAIPVSQSGSWSVNLGSTASDRTNIAQSLNTSQTSNAIALATPGTGSASIQITGAGWTGTLIFEATTDGTNWYPINAIVPNTGAIVGTTTSNGSWLVPCAGYAQIRVRPSVAGSGTATVSLEASQGDQAVSLANPLPAGTNSIGSVTLGTGANTVGAVTQASGPWTQNLTQVGGTAITIGQAAMAASLPVVVASNQSAIPVSQSGTWNVGLSAGANTIGAVNQAGTWTMATNADSPIGGGTAPAKALLVAGVYNSTPPTLTTGQVAGLQTDSNGRLLVNVAVNSGGGGSGGTSATDTATFTAGTTAGTPAMGAFNDGLSAITSGELGVTRITPNRALHVNIRNQGGTELATSTNPLRIDPVGTTTQPVSVVVALPTGANTIGAVTQASGPWTTNITQIGGGSLALGQAAMVASIPVVIASNQSAVPVSQSGTWTVNLGSTAADRTNIGQTLNTSSTNTTVALTAPGTGTASVQINGSWTGTIVFEATTDGINWYSINAIVPTTGAIVTSTTASGAWLVPCAGYAQIRVRTSVAGTGSAAVSLEASAGTQAITLANPLPSGANGIGAVAQSGTWTVGINTSIPAGSNLIGHIDGSVASGATNANNPVKTGGVFNSTQPTVSNGQVVDSQYTAHGAAIVATGTDTFNVTINAALPTGSNVIGAVTQSGTWNVTVNTALPTGANSIGTVGLNAGSNLIGHIDGAVASGAANADNPVKTGGVFNTTQPTVTNGQVVDSQYTARGAAIVATGVDTFNVTVNAALPTGSNVIGAVTQSGTWTVQQGSAPWSVQGAVASGSSNADNPVKVGGVFNTTQPTVSNGQVVDGQYTARGASIVATGVDTFNVTVNTALPTGSNVIGAVTQSGTWTMATNADVPVGGGTAPSKALVVGGVFNSTLPTLTNGQSSGIQVDSSGRILVNVAAGGGSGGVSAADGTAFTAGTTSGTAIQGVFNDSVATLTSGSEGTLRATTNRALHVNIRTAGGVELATATAPIRIDPVGTTSQPISFSTSLPGGSNLIGHIDGAVASGSANADNPVKVGGVFNTGQVTVTTGQVVDAQYTAHGAAIVATGTDAFSVSQSGTWNVTVNTALPAGTNTVGGVTLPDLEASLSAGTAPSKMVVGGAQFNTSLPAATNAQTVANQCDASGAQFVNTTNRVPTYEQSLAANTTQFAGAPTDAFTITGSATKTIRILRIEVISYGNTSSVASNNLVVLILRSTADTSGTVLQSGNGAPRDQNDASPGTATVRQYSANPTLGVQAAIIRQQGLIFATGQLATSLVFDFTQGKPVVLRGTSQVLAINFNSAALPTGGPPVIIANFTWQEDNQ